MFVRFPAYICFCKSSAARVQDKAPPASMTKAAPRRTTRVRGVDCVAAAVPTCWSPPADAMVPLMSGRSPGAPEFGLEDFTLHAVVTNHHKTI